MEPTTHLRSLQALDLALRLGSLKAAAEALAITPAAVGQRIKTLEDALGVDLLVRGRSGLKPTTELSHALPHLEKGFDELGAAFQALNLQRTNEIHIAANTDWVALWLAPRLPTFQSAYPNVRFCINGEGTAPMRLSKSDVEVNFAAPEVNENVETLFRDYLAPITAPENVSRVTKTRKRCKLENLPLLHLDFYKNDPEAIDWPQWFKCYGQRKSAFNRGIRFRNITTGIDAVKSGAGFMICGLAMVLDEIENGNLCLPFPVDQGASTGFAFQAKYRSPAMQRVHIRRFRKWLAAEAQKTGDLLESTLSG